MNEAYLMALRAMQAAAQYLVIGDSIAGTFDGIVLQGDGGPIAVTARWQPGMRCRELISDGRLSEFVTRALRELRHLMLDPHGDGVPFACVAETLSHGTRRPMHFKPRHRERLVLAFAIGESDLNDISHELHRRYDFDLPVGSPQFAGGSEIIEATEKLSIERIREIIRERCAPLFQAVDALQTAGFSHIFLNSMTPPSTVQPAGWSRPTLRFKLAVVFNEVLDAFARARGVALLDAWSIVFNGEGRRSEFDRDGAHLTTEAMLSVTEQWWQRMAGRQVKQ